MFKKRLTPEEEAAAAEKAAIDKLKAATGRVTAANGVARYAAAAKANGAAHGAVKLGTRTAPLKLRPDLVPALRAQTL